MWRSDAGFQAVRVRRDARCMRRTRHHSYPVAYVVSHRVEDAEARLIRAPPPSTLCRINNNEEQVSVPRFQRTRLG